DVARAAADRRDGVAKLAAEVAATRSRLAAMGDEIGRLEAARVEASARASSAQHEFTALESRVAGLDAGEEDLDDAYERATDGLRAATERVETLLTEERDAERLRA